jgi:hypothetical protein
MARHDLHRTSEANTLDVLERPVNQADTVVSRISASQEWLPTPCEEWDVKALLGHVVGHSMPNFIMAAAGETPDWRPRAPTVAAQADWPDAYRAAAGSTAEKRSPRHLITAPCLLRQRNNS